MLLCDARSALENHSIYVNKPISLQQYYVHCELTTRVYNISCLLNFNSSIIGYPHSASSLVTWSSVKLALVSCQVSEFIEVLFLIFNTINVARLTTSCNVLVLVSF